MKPRTGGGAWGLELVWSELRVEGRQVVRQPGLQRDITYSWSVMPSDLARFSSSALICGVTSKVILAGMLRSH